MDSRTGPNQFAPSSWGHKDMAGEGGGKVAGGGGSRVSEFFFTKNPNLKKKWGGGVGRLMDSRTGPNQFAPSSWGHNNALMYKLCPGQAQFMTILSVDLQV